MDIGRGQRQALGRVKVLRTINEALEAAFAKHKNCRVWPQAMLQKNDLMNSFSRHVPHLPASP